MLSTEESSSTTTTPTTTTTTTLSSNTTTPANFAKDIDFENLVFKHEENTKKDERSIQMAFECRRRLIEATEKIYKEVTSTSSSSSSSSSSPTDNKTKTKTNKLGIILSGGVDTCAILEAAAESSLNITFDVAITVVVIGGDGDTTTSPPDELYSKYAAYKHSNIIKKHVIIRMTPTQLVKTYLPSTIEILQTWDGMTVRNSLVIAAAFQQASQELGLTDVIVGDGADELFGGYSFMWGSTPDNMTTSEEWKDKRDSMCSKWTFATNDIAKHYNLKSYSPYMDHEIMVHWALENTQRDDCISYDQCYIQLTLGGPYEIHTTGKVLLREAFVTGSSWRRKDPIEVGSGITIIGYDEYWTNYHNITDEEFRTEQTTLRKEHGIIINSKEYLMNFRTYQQVFGGIVHSTKQRYPMNDDRGCIGCCFEIGSTTSMFCHICGAYPAQRNSPSPPSSPTTATTVTTTES